MSDAVLTLTVTEGPRAGESFRFAGRGTVLVGRSPEANLHVEDPYLSRHHFLIEVNPPNCRLTDLKARNPTQVNGVPVPEGQAADLRPGDLIRAGRTVIRVSQEAGALPGGMDTLALPAAAPSTIGYEGGSTDAPAASVPTVEGYEIVGELGRGGMGVVYRAKRKSDGLAVALKTVLPAGRVSPRNVERFLREASILRELDHPHIVSCLDTGESAGTLFFAMRLVEGTDAGRMLREQGPLPVKTAVRMACQLLSALSYAHERGFVHRDIKPANLLVEEVEGKRAVRLADFGLARAYQQSRMSGVTVEGDIGGTLAFMAPEQIVEFHRVGPRADLYSAAATLYNLLTGAFPHDEAEDRGTALARLLEEDAAPARSRRADLPAHLAALIDRGLSRRPEGRFPDAAGFRAALVGYA